LTRTSAPKDTIIKNPNKIYEMFGEVKYTFTNTNLLSGKKPENLIIIKSSKYLNDISLSLGKVFTVFTKEYIKENNVSINCGDKKCIDCLICYTQNNTKFINEKLK
jgi:hypothetical protein